MSAEAMTPQIDPRGLSSDEAARRLARDGRNDLPPAHRTPMVVKLLRQFTHFFALMLWAAGILALVGGMAELGIAIFFVVALNGVFAFAQEFRAERASERLRVLVPRRVSVVRDGRSSTIDAGDLVVGDLVRLEAGDRLAADLELTDAHGLALDTSMLTGESIATRPAVGDVLHAGTFVIEGEAFAQVRAIGARTRLAGISALTRGRHHPTPPLALEIARLVRIVAVIAVSVGGLFFLVGVLVGLPVQQGFLFAIGVTVALVPEGLLPTITLSLALGARRMAAENALVRRLEAVETLGSTTFICTDKTGTLTRNEMSVVRVWTAGGSALIAGAGYGPSALLQFAPHRDVAQPLVLQVALAARTCSTGRVIQHDGRWGPHGDPMEAAIDALVHRLGHAVEPSVDPAREPMRRFPFDPHRRRMSAVVGRTLFTKGAPDGLLARCSNIAGAQEALESMAAEGLRVLAVAERTLTDEDLRHLDAASADELERDLTLVGLIALEDPPRDDVATAIARCRAAGVRVAMITGDHASTARAIAQRVGLLAADEWVVRGSELPADEQMLGALVDRDGIVVCRVDPEDKLRIAKALQARGHVVAMTGDGVNDGPALQQADVGIAMGLSGTDVAREAADVVLLDDHFGTIVEAIAHGRAAFSNVRRMLAFHLTDNVAELAPFVLWALSAGRFPLALSVVQILCLDLITDQLPALALGTEKPDLDQLALPPRAGSLVDRALLVRALLVMGVAEAAIEIGVFAGSLLASGYRFGAVPPAAGAVAAASGAAFAAVVLSQVANAFACRSETRSAWRLNWFSNPALIGATAFSVAAMFTLMAVPRIATVVGHAMPRGSSWWPALAAIPAVLLVDTVYKRIRTWVVARRSRTV